MNMTAGSPDSAEKAAPAAGSLVLDILADLSSVRPLSILRLVCGW